MPITKDEANELRALVRYYRDACEEWARVYGTASSKELHTLSERCNVTWQALDNYINELTEKE